MVRSGPRPLPCAYSATPRFPALWHHPRLVSSPLVSVPESTVPHHRRASCPSIASPTAHALGLLLPGAVPLKHLLRLHDSLPSSASHSCSPQWLLLVMPPLPPPSAPRTVVYRADAADAPTPSCHTLLHCVMLPAAAGELPIERWNPFPGPCSILRKEPR